MNWFKHRRLVIATKHGKERVIAPLLTEELGVLPFSPKNFDTDIFGTFSGEIERKHSPIEAARHKCLEALKIEGCELAIASEGSFGPHPSYGFISADEEVLYFMDTRHNIEIAQRELSLNTNSNSAEISTFDEILSFADSVGFPSHGLIIKAALHDGSREIVKGITNERLLYDTFKRLSANNKKITVETDMRANFNPTRMNVIKNCTIKLVARIKSNCPRCDWPGFGVTKSIPGLPCELCSFPTRSTLAHIYSCAHCNYSKKKFHPHGKSTEESIFCDHCNP